MTKQLQKMNKALVHYNSLKKYVNMHALGKIQLAADGDKPAVNYHGNYNSSQNLNHT